MFCMVSNNFVGFHIPGLGLATANLILRLFLAENVLRLCTLNISHAVRLTHKNNLDDPFLSRHALYQ